MKTESCLVVSHLSDTFKAKEENMILCNDVTDAHWVYWMLLRSTMCLERRIEKRIFCLSLLLGRVPNHMS